MPVPKKLLALVAPAALLALSACTTGFRTQVARFQAMPAPEGQSFVIQAADPRDRGGLEFSQYAELVRRHMVEQGYREAASPEGATLVVSLGYGVDNGQTKIVSYPSTGFGPHYGYWPYYSRFGGYYPYYYGWHDPFWGYPDVRSYTVYTSYLDLNIRRAADGQSVFEGKAKARSQSDELPTLVPNLIEAIFTGFPGRSGEVVKITVPPPARAG
jgi:hypothetical protein